MAKVRRRCMNIYDPKTGELLGRGHFTRPPTERDKQTLRDLINAVKTWPCPSRNSGKHDQCLKGKPIKQVTMSEKLEPIISDIPGPCFCVACYGG
jgi:hypothetical protein